MGRVQAIQLEYSDSYQVSISPWLNINSALFNILQFESIKFICFIYYFIIFYCSLFCLNLRFLTSCLLSVLWWQSAKLPRNVLQVRLSVCLSVCHRSLSLSLFLSLSISPFIFIFLSSSLIKHHSSTRHLCRSCCAVQAYRIDYCCPACFNCIASKSFSFERAFSLSHRSLTFNISWPWSYRPSSPSSSSSRYSPSSSPSSSSPSSSHFTLSFPYSNLLHVHS